MNHIEFGKERDNRIVRVITQGGIFTRTQLQKIMLPKKKSATRIMQHRLQRLVKYERISKIERESYEPNLYYVKKPKHVEHALLINNVYVALVEQKPSFYHVDFEWSYPILGGKVIADALITIYTDPDRKRKQVVFLEVERDPGKKFNKVDNYTKIFQSKWAEEEWAVRKDGAAYFPTVLIVTDTKLVIPEEKPRFIVCDNTRVRQDIYSAILRRDLL